MVDFQFLIYCGIGAGILAAIALIGSHFATIVSIISGEWSRSIERARKQKAYREQLYGYADVNDYQDVMSRQAGRPQQTDKTDGQTDPVSAADQWVERLELDRTKTTLIELLVYSGWDASQVRAVLKGDNGALGAEVEAARKRLGIEPPPPRMIAVRDNGAPPRNIPMDSDYPYQALEA